MSREKSTPRTVQMHLILSDSLPELSLPSPLSAMQKLDEFLTLKKAGGSLNAHAFFFEYSEFPDTLMNLSVRHSVFRTFRFTFQHSADHDKRLFLHYLNQ
jgi:hypothetical protein